MQGPWEAEGDSPRSSEAHAGSHQTRTLWGIQAHRFCPGGADAGPGRLPAVGGRCGLSPGLDQRLTVHAERGQRAGPAQRPDRHLRSHLSVPTAAAGRAGQSPALGEEQEVGGGAQNLAPAPLPALPRPPVTSVLCSF